MILIIECVAACVIFGGIITASVLGDKTAWLHEYSPAVQQRFLECNPDYVPKGKTQMTAGLVAAKVLVSLLFAAVLTGMVRLAGARDFITGALCSYIIWAVVNIFDVFALDLGLFARWKAIRLPGTEDMDAEYRSNTRKHLLDGLYGMLIGVPVCCLCGLAVTVIA